MSSDEGMKIISALKAFEANRIIRSDVTSLLTVALRSGGILPRHIEKLHAALEKEVAALPANFGVVRPEKFQGCTFIAYGHMSVDKDVNGTPLYNQYTPNIVSYAIIRDDYTRRQCLLPISFNAHHTRFRFNERTRNVLDYKSEDFAEALSFATLMMHALSRGPRPPRPVPMFVPHADGLFLGYAEAMPGDTYRIRSDHTARRGKRVELQRHVADERVQPFIPTTRAVLNTFISKDDMTPLKFDVWRQLHAMLAAPENEFTIARALMCQTTGTYLVTPDQLEEQKALQDAVLGAMASGPWRRLSQNAISNGHVPALHYEDRQKRAGDAASGIELRL